MFWKFREFTDASSFNFNFSFPDPDTGVVLKAKTKQELIDRVTAYRRQNNLEEIEALAFVIENYWCGLPGNAGLCVPIEKMPRGWLGYLKGGIALVKNIAYGRTVSQEVAETRAEQCADCKFNVFPAEEGFIHWSNKIAEASVGDKKVKRQEELGQCAVCTCPMKAKVWLAGRIPIEKEWEEPMKEVSCWQLKSRK